MQVRLRLDIGWWDLLSGFIGGLHGGDRRAERAELEHQCAPSGNAVVCLSVRTALDLYLDACDWPEGSEVLFSALNLPEMAAVVREHGLVPVPVDHDLDAGLPSVAEFEAARTPRTRGILVAHLFGMQGDLGPLVGYARQHGLAIIEDCAQAFAGRDERGHAGADASLFSFGPIKTATALGGAIAYVRDGRLRDAMCRRRDSYPTQGTVEFLRRVLRTGLLKLASYPLCFAALAWLWRRRGKDLDQLLHSAVKNLPPGELCRAIRRQCSLPQVRLLARRLRNYRRPQLHARIAAARALAAALPSHLQPVGAGLRRHIFWVFPVRAADPPALIEALRQHGFDATTRNSMAVLDPPEGSAHPPADRVQAYFRQLVFLPCHGGMDAHTIGRLANAARSTPRAEVPATVSAART